MGCPTKKGEQKAFTSVYNKTYMPDKRGNPSSHKRDLVREDST
jgi:hypothetical protein